MHKIHVSFSSWERKAQGSVTPTVSNFLDGKTAGCSVLTPWYEEETGTPEYSRWRYKPSRCGGQYLHGPASLLYDRSIVYPCQSRRCQIACPCFGCRGYLVKNLSAETRFQDHKSYHHATHANCEFCCQLLEALPFFTFDLHIHKGSSLYAEGVYEVKIKTYEFRHNFALEEKTKRKSATKCPLKCEQCGKRFKTASNRERHFINVHCKQNIFKCETCKKVFGRMDNLQRHMKIHQDTDELAYHSDSEDESDVKARSNVKDYEEISISGDTSDDDGEDSSDLHGSETEDDVGNGNSAEFGISNDRETDVSVKDDDDESSEDHDSIEAKTEKSKDVMKDKNSCELCGKMYSTKYNMEVHKRQMKITCDACVLSFCSKGALVSHKKSTHKQKRIFKCDLCPREFDLQTNLKRHLNSRSRSKCEFCSVLLCNKVDLTRHVYQEHKCKVCEICNEKHEYIHQHMREVHGK